MLSDTIVQANTELSLLPTLGPELLILLPQPLESWTYGPILPHLPLDLSLPRGTWRDAEGFFSDGGSSLRTGSRGDSGIGLVPRKRVFHTCVMEDARDPSACEAPQMI